MICTLSRRLAAIGLVLAGGLVAPALAAAHARVSPAVSLSGKLQLYSLAVPTEKAGVTTTKVIMTVPAGFSVDSFVPPPSGWSQRLQQTGSGDNAVVQKVTWTGGHTPTGQDSLFQFLAQPAAPGSYSFDIQQTYSDGSIVNWDGPESSAAPAATIEVAASLGGGGQTSTLTIIALVVGVAGLAAAGLALASGGRRSDGGGRPLV